MDRRKQMIGASTLLASLVLVAVLVITQFGFFLAPVQAQEEAGPTSMRTVTVVGEGSVSIDPDIATATVGVEVVEPSVMEAVTQARGTMQAVLEARLAANIGENDIQTTGYNIWAERNYNPSPMESDGNGEQVRYRVNNNVQLTIRDLDSISAVLDAAIEAGANNIYGVNFSLDDPIRVESEARAKAVENARTKAVELAGLTETQVGRVVSISEVIGQGGGYFGGNFAQSAREGLGGGGAGPIAPGQLKLTMQLQITYELQ